MRLIDADALMDALPVVTEDKQISIIGAVADFLMLIDDAPTVDALIPPCKPWDKVWIIDKTIDRVNGGLKNIICEGEIFKLSYNGFTTPMEWLDYRWDSPLVGQTTRHDRIDLCLGKTVFLTREEAEAALAKMDGGTNDGQIEI